MRRALLLTVLLAAALAPAAQARPSIVVEAAAKGYFGGFEQMAVQFECSAVELGGRPVRMNRCTFGPLSATASWCTGACVNPPVAVARGAGTVVLGQPYSLCVTASSYLPSGWQTVAKCAPFDYTTNSAVIAG